MEISPDLQTSRGVADFVAQDLSRILEALRGSDVLELDVQEGETRIRLHRQPSSGNQTRVEETSDEETDAFDGPQIVEVVAPLVGTFYGAAQPGASPLVSEGTHVDDETVVGIIEALQVLTEVEAGCTGTVVRVLATDGQPVQYGQPLIQVALDG